MPPALLDAIVRYYDPIQFILLVAVDDDTPSDKLRLRSAYQAITGTRIAADVVPVWASRFASGP